MESPCNGERRLQLDHRKSPLLEIGHIFLCCCTKEPSGHPPTYRLLVVLHNLMVESYCGGHNLLMSSTVEKSSWCLTRSSTPTWLTFVGLKRYPACYWRRNVIISITQLQTCALPQWPVNKIGWGNRGTNAMWVTNGLFFFLMRFKAHSIRWNPLM